MITYKVVTKDLKSLGLRKNPTILQYLIHTVNILPKEMIKKGKDDFGGIWTCKSLSGAKKIQKYMKDKYNKKVRIFKSLIGDILYQNNYRIKTNWIILCKEIK